MLIAQCHSSPRRPPFGVAHLEQAVAALAILVAGDCGRGRHLPVPRGQRGGRAGYGLADGTPERRCCLRLSFRCSAITDGLLGFVGHSLGSLAGLLDTASAGTHGAGGRCRVQSGRQDARIGEMGRHSHAAGREAQREMNRPSRHVRRSVGSPANPRPLTATTWIAPLPAVK